MLVFILPRIFLRSSPRFWIGVGMGRMLLLREGKELRKHLSFTHSSRTRAGTEDPAGSRALCWSQRWGKHWPMDGQMDRQARGAAAWAPKVGDHPQGAHGREGTFPAFWFLLILHQAERKNHGTFFHISRRSGHSSYHTRVFLPHPGDSATARPPPWAPTPGIQPLLPTSHQGMRQDSASLHGWAGKDGEPTTTGLLQRWKGLVQRKISLPDQKERFQYILIVKWFLFFFKQCPTWMSLSRNFASRSCCTGAKPRRSWLYLCTTVPKNSQRAANTTKHLPGNHHHGTGLCSGSQEKSRS